MIVAINGDGTLAQGVIRCVERKEQGKVLEGDPGDYCAKIMNGTIDPSSTGTYQVYRMP